MICLELNGQVRCRYSSQIELQPISVQALEARDGRKHLRENEIYLEIVDSLCAQCTPEVCPEKSDRRASVLGVVRDIKAMAPTTPLGTEFLYTEIPKTHSPTEAINLKR